MGIDVFDLHLLGINFAIELCCAIFTSIVMFAVILRQKQTKEIRSFILFTLFSAIALWTDSFSFMCEGNPDMVIVMKLLCVTSFAASAYAAIMFLMYVFSYFEERCNITYPKWLKNTFLIYGVLCSLFYISSLWTGWLYSVDAESFYVDGEYVYLTGVMLIPVAITSISVIMKNRKNVLKKDSNLLLFYNISYLALGLVDGAFTLSIHYIVMTAFVILIYIFISLEKDKTLEIKEKELVISELNALRLQMNPHFVYNTLASIDGLIMIDPDEARSLIGKFTKHLRSSYLDNSPNTVPFETELENIKCYLSVEEIRFPNIKIEYDLGVTDFELPPLTVQPILENAVKHGICGREDGKGTIVISTYETDKSYNISIKDNGVGFDVKAPRKKDGRSHIGVDNTKIRLELICNGRLEINSIVGVGTESTIIIPKE